MTGHFFPVPFSTEANRSSNFMVLHSLTWKKHCGENLMGLYKPQKAYQTLMLKKKNMHSEGLFGYRIYTMIPEEY